MNGTLTQFIIGVSVGSYLGTLFINANSFQYNYIRRYRVYKPRFKDASLLGISAAGTAIGVYLISEKYLSPLYAALPEVPFWVLAYFTSSVGCLIGTIRNI